MEKKSFDKVFKVVMSGWAELFTEFDDVKKEITAFIPLNAEKVGWTERREDGFFQVFYSDGTFDYLHIEIQATNHNEMLERMMEYFVMDYKLYKKATKQYVLYVGEAPMKMQSSLDVPAMRYHYRLIDIRELSPTLFFNRPSWRFWVFAYLTASDVPAQNALIQTIIERLIALKLPQHEFFEAIHTLSALAPLRSAEETVKNTIEKMTLELHYDVRNMPFYEKVFSEGAAEGKAEGKAEAAIETRNEIIRSMAENGATIAFIAKTVKLDEETVKIILNS